MPELREVTVEVRGMTCDHCERTVAGALQSVPGVKEVLEVSHAGAVARVRAEPEATAERIEQAVARVGYRARVKEAPQALAARTGSARAGEDFDLIVVGGGSAGFAAAIKAPALGARGAMAEGGAPGGTGVEVGVFSL